jgi:hypothetical protein
MRRILLFSRFHFFSISFFLPFAATSGLAPGTDVMIFKIFLPKKIGKKLAFLTQNKAKLCKILIMTLVFEKKANFFAENCQKSQKIVIITSTPDEFVKKSPEMYLHSATLFCHQQCINLTVE